LRTSSPDCREVLTHLAHFADKCGTREAASRRLGVAKGTLTKWFAKGSMSVSSLQMLARFEGDADLARAARDVLGASRIRLACFDFGHIASQLLCAGPAANRLFYALNGNPSPQECEFYAIHDLIAALADTHYYEALTETALAGFQQLPDHPLLTLGVADFERPIFSDDPDDDELQEDSPGQEITWESIDWEEIDKPYKRREEAARSILHTAVHEPRHRLFEQIIEHTACGTKDRTSKTPRLIEKACVEIAANAAAYAYKQESAVIEVSRTVRNAVNDAPALQDSPLYAVATKLFEMRHAARSRTIHRVAWLKEKVKENEKLVRKIDGICRFVYQALHSEAGVTFSHGRFAEAHVNKHGSVLDYEKGRIVRSVVGKKRLAPKRAVTRMYPRRHGRGG
jgi:hypothetical protein